MQGRFPIGSGRIANHPGVNCGATVQCGRVASKSRKKRLCRLLCGKPLAFRRRQPPFFPSARLEGSAFQPSRGR